MYFQEEKYFRPYVPLHRKYSPVHSPSAQYLEARRPLELSRSITSNNNNHTSPTKPAASPSPSKRNTVDKPIWDLLYEQGMELRRNIDEKHKQKVAKLDDECTFKPLLRGKSERYFPQQQKFIDRNTIWQQNRIRKQVKEREELTSRNLKECTFTPKFLTKNRDGHPPTPPRNRHARHREQQKESRLLLPQPSRTNFEDIRGRIRSELQNLKL